jgi:hypothetical protein
MLRHHLYEFLMIFKFFKGLRAFKSCDNGGRRDIPPLDLETYIRAAVKSYDGSEHFQYRDISCALGVCAPAAAGLMQTSIFLEGKQPDTRHSGLYENLQY